MTVRLLTWKVLFFSWSSHSLLTFIPISSPLPIEFCFEFLLHKKVASLLQLNAIFSCHGISILFACSSCLWLSIGCDYRICISDCFGWKWGSRMSKRTWMEAIGSDVKLFKYVLGSLLNKLEKEDSCS